MTNREKFNEFLEHRVMELEMMNDNDFVKDMQYASSWSNLFFGYARCMGYTGYFDNESKMTEWLKQEAL